MYEYIIGEYVNKLTEKDIKSYALKKNIHITDEEVKVIYLYIKNYWREFYRGEANELFKELKEKISPEAYNIVIKLYSEYKNKIN